MFSGKVSVEVLGACNLPTKYSSLDSYVQIKVDNFEVFLTTTAKDTFNPVWNESKEFVKGNAEQISLTVLEDDKEKGVIAECMLSLNNLLVEQIGRDSLKLKQSLTPQGELHLEISLREDDKTDTLKRRNAVEKIYRVRGHDLKKSFSHNQLFVLKIPNLSGVSASKE